MSTTWRGGEADQGGLQHASWGPGVFRFCVSSHLSVPRVDISNILPPHPIPARRPVPQAGMNNQRQIQK